MKSYARTSAAGIMPCSPPAAVIPKSHFIVVFGVRDQQFLIINPARGFVLMAADMFNEAWQKHGIAVLIAPSLKQAKINCATINLTPPVAI